MKSTMQKMGLTPQKIQFLRDNIGFFQCGPQNISANLVRVGRSGRTFMLVAHTLDDDDNFAADGGLRCASAKKQSNAP